jgi:Josephin
VCHNNHHWIAIRKVHNTWFNLNSKNSDGPQIISDFYLSAFISGIEDGGYEVFVVTGTLPNLSQNMFDDNLRKH